MEQLKQIQTYYDHTYLFKHQSPILTVEQAKIQDPKTKVENEIIKLLLAENIFHPQGGGQPDDEGFIEINNNQFPVQSLTNDKQASKVYLNLGFTQELLDQLKNLQGNNLNVIQTINEEKRRMNARLHSGGHFLDMAVRQVGLNWVPGKGFHFPDGSYVEYIGTIEGKPEDIAQSIQKACNELIAKSIEDDKKVVEYLNNEQLAQKLGELPEYLKNAQNVRYVQLNSQDKGCPCGGTHVDHIKEIGNVVITKVKKSGKNVRVSYKVQ